jgi:hypothetical protein
MIKIQGIKIWTRFNTVGIVTSCGVLWRRFLFSTSTYFQIINIAQYIPSIYNPCHGLEFDVTYCHVYEVTIDKFRLVIDFIYPLKSWLQVIITLSFISTLYKSLQHTLRLLSLVSLVFFPVTDLNNGDSLASVPMFSGECPTAVIDSTA